jgi:hypothetical protein
VFSKYSSIQDYVLVLVVFLYNITYCKLLDPRLRLVFRRQPLSSKSPFDLYFVQSGIYSSHQDCVLVFGRWNVWVWAMRRESLDLGKWGNCDPGPATQLQGILKDEFNHTAQQYLSQLSILLIRFSNRPTTPTNTNQSSVIQQRSPPKV